LVHCGAWPNSIFFTGSAPTGAVGAGLDLGSRSVTVQG
jgi:hypothetical protein